MVGVEYLLFECSLAHFYYLCLWSCTSCMWRVSASTGVGLCAIWVVQLHCLWNCDVVGWALFSCRMISFCKALKSSCSQFCSIDLSQVSCSSRLCLGLGFVDIVNLFLYLLSGTGLKSIIMVWIFVIVPLPCLVLGFFGALCSVAAEYLELGFSIRHISTVAWSYGIPNVFPK